MDIQRIKTAVSFLEDGLSFKVDGLRLGYHENIIEVAGWTTSVTLLSHVDQAKAIFKLNEIKDLFYQMIDVSSDLRDFSAGKKIDFTLYYDDSGKTSIKICSERDGVCHYCL